MQKFLKKLPKATTNEHLTQSDWQNVLTADYSKLNILTKLGKMDPPMGLLKNPEFF